MTDLDLSHFWHNGLKTTNDNVDVTKNVTTDKTMTKGLESIKETPRPNKLPIANQTDVMSHVRPSMTRQMTKTVVQTIGKIYASKLITSSKPYKNYSINSDCGKQN